MPAALWYAPLIRELGTTVHPVTKDLEVYRDPQPPPDYSIDIEIAGVSRVADEVGFKQFHRIARCRACTRGGGTPKALGMTLGRLNPVD